MFKNDKMLSNDLKTFLRILLRKFISVNNLFIYKMGLNEFRKQAQYTLNIMLFYLLFFFCLEVVIIFFFFKKRILYKIIVVKISIFTIITISNYYITEDPFRKFIRITQIIIKYCE